MPQVVVTAKLWVKDARFEEFKRFEARAFDIMKRYGTEVLDIEKDHAQTSSTAPHETHVLRFPDRTAFDAYRTDKDLLAMADLRDACIARTVVDVREE